MDAEISLLKKELRKNIVIKNKLLTQIDELDVFDETYDMKYQDLNFRINKYYQFIKIAEDSISELEKRKESIEKQKITKENVYIILSNFDKLYDKFTDAEKKEFVNNFISKIDIWAEPDKNGKFLKSIDFNFPVYFNGNETSSICLDKETTGEYVILLTK